jgi:hypothetical protein
MTWRDELLSFVTVLYTMKFGMTNIFGVLYYDVISSAMFVGNGAAFKRRDAHADCIADPASRSTLARFIVLQIWNVL